MSPTKGVVDAIEIARRAGVPLLIAAKMQGRSEQEYFDAAVSPRLGGDVQYVGNVGGADKIDLLTHAIALLDPIRWDEPFGLCMVEALACGTPVLVTPCGAAPEIIDDGVTGYVRAGTDELAAVVPHVSSLDRRACRAAVEARFSAERMAQEHIALYEDVLATGCVRASA
jgi:glycosyltransferase involved in cell wall biosynthesis